MANYAQPESIALQEQQLNSIVWEGPLITEKDPGSAKTVQRDTIVREDQITRLCVHQDSSVHSNQLPVRTAQMELTTLKTNLKPRLNVDLAQLVNTAQAARSVEHALQASSATQALFLPLTQLKLVQSAITAFQERQPL